MQDKENQIYHGEMFIYIFKKRPRAQHLVASSGKKRILQMN